MSETAKCILDEYYAPYEASSVIEGKSSAFRPSIRLAERYCPAYSNLDEIKEKLPPMKSKGKKKATDEASDESSEEDETLLSKRSRKLKLSQQDLREIGNQLNDILSGQFPDKSSNDVARSLRDMQTLIERKVVPAP